MRLEMSARWRGWTALLIGLLDLVSIILLRDVPRDETVWIVPGLLFLPAAILARGWYKRRRQIHLLRYHARSIARAQVER
jgi:hypothetical protein